MRFLRRTVLVAPLLALVAIVAGLPSVALGNEDGRHFSTQLLGIHEVPSVNSPATATLRLEINRSNTSISYELRFTAPPSGVTQSHVHFSENHVSGGVMFFLCGTTASPGPAGTPTCPANGGVVKGTITSANVIGPAAQALPAGDIAAVIRAIRTGAAYGNLHSTSFPAGEIRGQLRKDD